MNLETFKTLVQKWIEKNFDNVELSGVAEVIDDSELRWSASLAVVKDGSFPSIRPENIKEVRRLCQELPLEGGTLSFVYVIRFIMGPDLRSMRWQVQWLFRN